MKNIAKSAIVLAFAALAATGSANAASVSFDSAAFGRLPDGNATGVTRTIDVTATGVVTDVNLTLNDARTTWIGDLIVSLTSPTGTVVDLLCRVGNSVCGNFGDSSNLNGAYTFDDEAAVNIADAAATAPGNSRIAPGSYSTTGSAGRNAGLLSTFDGEDAFGLWSLTISDNAGLDIARIGTASLSLEVAPVPLPATLPLLAVGLGALGFAARRKS